VAVPGELKWNAMAYIGHQIGMTHAQLLFQEVKADRIPIDALVNVQFQPAAASLFENRPPHTPCKQMI